jgi:hypothetical protein
LQLYLLQLVQALKYEPKPANIEAVNFAALGLSMSSTGGGLSGSGGDVNLQAHFLSMIDNGLKAAADAAAASGGARSSSSGSVSFSTPLPAHTPSSPTSANSSSNNGSNVNVNVSGRDEGGDNRQVPLIPQLLLSPLAQFLIYR